MAEDLKLQVVLNAVDTMTAPLRKALGVSNQLEDQLAATRRELRDLNTTSKDIEGFAKLQTQITDNNASIKLAETRLQNYQQKLLDAQQSSQKFTGELAEAEQQLSELQQKIQSTENPTKKLTNQFNSAAKKVETLQKRLFTAENNTEKFSASITKTEIRLSKLNQKQQHYNQTANDTGQRLKKAGVNTKQLAEHQEQLKTKIDQTTTAFRSQAAELKKLNHQKFKQQQMLKQRDQVLQRASNMTVSGAGAMYTGQRIAGFLGSGYQGESNIADIAITAKLDNAQIAEIRELTSKAITETHQTKSALTNSLNSMVTDGMEYETAKKLLIPTGKAATASGAEMLDVAKTGYTLQNSLGINPENIEKSYDILVSAGSSGGFELENMAKFFPVIGAEAQKLGMQGQESVASIAAALQIAKDAAGSPDEAANNMKNFLAKITAPDTVKNFKKFGVNVQKEIEAGLSQGVNPIETMINLVKETTGGDNFKMSKLFGDMQAKAFITPMIQHWEKYKKIKQDALSADGTVYADLQRRYELDPTLAAQDLTESLNDLKDTAVRPLIPSITMVTMEINKLLRPVGQWIKNNPELSQTILKFALIAGGTVAVLGTLVMVIGSLLAPIAIVRYGFGMLGLKAGWLKATFGTVFRVIKMLGFGIVMLGRVLMMNPIGLAITAIAGAAMLLYYNWDKVKAGFVGGISAMSNRIQGWVAEMREHPHKIITFFATLPIKLAQLGMDAINGFIKGMFDVDIAAAAKRIGNSIVGSVKDVLGIKSPSRVFMGIGDDTIAGLQLGLNQATPQLNAQLQQTAQMIPIPFRAAANDASLNQPAADRFNDPKVTDLLAVRAQHHQSQSVSAPMNVTINIHAAEGQDVRAIGDVVDQRLREREQQNIRRARGGMFDRG